VLLDDDTQEAGSKEEVYGLYSVSTLHWTAKERRISDVNQRFKKGAQDHQENVSSGRSLTERVPNPPYQDTEDVINEYMVTECPDKRVHFSQIVQEFLV